MRPERLAAGPGTGPARGFQLYELLVVVAIVGLVTALGLPPLLGWSRAVRLRVAAGEVAATLRLARSLAIRRGTAVGVKFTVAAEGAVSWVLYRDGDGDGVRTADVAAGVDPALTSPRALAHQGRRVGFGFPPGPPPLDPGDPRRRLDRLDDPLRLGRSDIASFNAQGEGSSGSLYLTDGLRGLVVVRLFGRTGKVRVLTYHPGTPEWR